MPIRPDFVFAMTMKRFSTCLVLAAAALLGAAQASAQEKVWRCGNEYTNNAAEAQRRGCRVMEGGNITVVQGTRPYASAAPAGGGAGPVRAPTGSPRVDSAEQRARDSDARAILDSELRKAEARQADLQKQYNNGEPEKQGSESRNYQKYLDRVADMKAEIDRNQSDIAGIRRELDRLPPAPAAAQ